MENLILSVDIINDDGKKQKALMLVTKTTQTAGEWTNGIFSVGLEKGKDGVKVQTKILSYNQDAELYNEITTFTDCFTKSIGGLVGYTNA